MRNGEGGDPGELRRGSRGAPEPHRPEQSGGSSRSAPGEPGGGRFIDPRLGLLAGEGAQQRIGGVEPPAPVEVWSDLPSRAPMDEAGPTYYGRPALKEPVWIWAVPVYFYVGGTAGAAAVLAGAAQALGGEQMRGLVRRLRWVAAAGCGAGSVLLVYDLGRPERFLNMLRVFRPSSPMSVGSWVLAGTASAAGGAAILSSARGWPRRLGDVAGYAAALLGLPLAGYTAVLLANTAIPLWQGARRSLPPLFVGSAASGLASLFGLLPASGPERAVVHRFGTAGKAAELAAMAAVAYETRREGAAGEPLRQGLAGALWKTAGALTAASLVLSLISHRLVSHRSPGPGRGAERRGARRLQVAESLLGTAGTLALRFAVFHAGKASARDPRATFRQQRARQNGSR